MTTPLLLHETRVKPEWIDGYNHMNVAHYVGVCDSATGAFWDHVNGGRGIENRGGHEYVVVESHVHYISEVVLDDPVHVTSQLVAHDDKRFILFHRMWKSADDRLSATNEVKLLGFNLDKRRIEAFQPAVRDRLATLAAEHAGLGVPEQAGDGIMLKRRPGLR